MNQKTSEGRADIIHDFVERIDIFDLEPDDPDKFRIKVIIRTNTDADSFSEVEAAVNITVREQLDNDHQQKAPLGVLFELFANSRSFYQKE